MTTDCTQFLADLDAGVFANKIGDAITNAVRAAINFDNEGMVNVKVADLEAFGEGTTSIAALTGIAAIRQSEINTASTAGSEVAALSEARLAVPIALVFNLRPLPELAMRRVVVDFGVAPGEKVPALQLRIRELEALQESIATEFGEVVRATLAQLPDSVATVPFTGAFKW